VQADIYFDDEHLSIVIILWW